MWRLWDTESEEKQQWNKSTCQAIPVLASDSDDSIIFMAKMPSPLIQQPQVVGRASVGALPTFSSSASDTSSSLGEYWLTFLSDLINIINLKTFCYMAGTNKNDTNLYIAFLYCFS